MEGESLLMALKEIALSSGSACTSASLEPSYVLRALGADDEIAHSSIRFGIGRFTTEEDVDFAIDRVVKHVTKLREMSPLWEMVSDYDLQGHQFYLYLNRFRMELISRPFNGHNTKKGTFADSNLE